MQHSRITEILKNKHDASPVALPLSQRVKEAVFMGSMLYTSFALFCCASKVPFGTCSNSGLDDSSDGEEGKSFWQCSENTIKKDRPMQRLTALEILIS